MRPAQLARLIALGAIWGSSFLFMKIAVPAMGPVAMIGGRIAIAAIALSIVAWFLKKKLPRGKHWIPALVIGIFYTAMPLLLWGYASQQLSASLLSIINATAPLFGALLSLLWLAGHNSKRMSVHGIAGLVLGFAGVAVLVGGEGFSDSNTPTLAIAAAFLAIFSLRAAPFKSALILATAVSIPLFALGIAFELHSRYRRVRSRAQA